MTLTEKNVLLFDLDGTLVDSVPDIAFALNQSMQQLARKPFEEATVRNWVGNGARCLVARALSSNKVIDSQLSETEISEALTIFLRFYMDTACVQSRLYSNVKETLRKLKTKGYRLAIITNKPEAFIQPILEGLDLLNLFELQLGGDSLPERKPHPLPLLTACKRMDVSPQQCFMIGDSKNDILAAKAANMDSIGLSYGYNYDEDLAVHRPNYLFDHFDELLDVL